MPKAALITPFHPDIGGGAAHLRKLIVHFSELEVTWFFMGGGASTHPGSICLGPTVSGGPILNDLLRAVGIWTRMPNAQLTGYAEQILSLPFDAYWIVAMNETIPLGNLLHSRSDKPIHVSVQDDQADGLAGRSRRYRWLRGIMRREWLRLLRSASGIDVISREMEQYYRQRYDLESHTIHPYLPRLPKVPVHASSPQKRSVGHIGNIYSTAEFHAFLRVFGEVARGERKSPELVLVGGGSHDRELMRDALGSHASLLDFPSLDETDAIVQLAICDFLYAMYPFSEESRIFRCTSLPTKLTTYLQAQRPVLAHTPSDSTLASWVHENRLGVVAAATDETILRNSIREILSMAVDGDAFETTRRRLYSRDNVTQLESSIAFGAQVPFSSATR